METVPSRPKRSPSGLKRAWRRFRKPLAGSALVKSLLANGLASYMRLVKATNRRVEGSFSPAEAFADAPIILALWHGQHVSTPPFFPKDQPLVALVSRSADAEMNAVVLEKFGIGTVRGSGGRDREKAVEKGGVRALLALKKTLERGTNVCMIADIPHGEPRQAGDGIVALARISGRPIICAALATSRRKVFERSWDKTTISLPFGKYALAAAAPIYVSELADADELERIRAEVTDTLNQMTENAYNMVDGRT